MKIYNGAQKLVPEFVQFANTGDTFNLYFRAERTLLDYFYANSASCNMAGIYMLRAIIPQMVNHWVTTLRITRNPLLSLIFKLANDHIDAKGVCFLQSDVVHIHTALSNPCNNPLLCRPNDMPAFLLQCGPRAAWLIAISCNLTAYMLFILHREFQVPIDHKSTPDIYVHNGDEYFDSLIAKSTLFCPGGRSNNVCIMVMRSLTPNIQNGTVTVELFDQATRPPALVENYESRLGKIRLTSKLWNNDYESFK